MSFLTSLFKPRQITLAEGLAALAPAGIVLTPEADLQSIERELSMTSHTYLSLLLALGKREERVPPVYPPRCTTLWNFDAECINEEGDYAGIAERMAMLAGGNLPLTDIRDDIPEEGDVARLDFTLGKPYHLTLRLNGDWVDTAVFQELARLLIARGSPRRFTFHDLQAQNCLFGCATPEQRRHLNRLPGIDFRWLDESTF